MVLGMIGVQQAHQTGTQVVVVVVIKIRLIHLPLRRLNQKAVGHLIAKQRLENLMTGLGMIDET
jgi:hypothetical protein